MSKIVFGTYRAPVRGWEGSFAFARMKHHSQRPLESTTPYREKWQECTQEFVILQKALGIGYFGYRSGREALIIGPGADPTEAGLLFGAFPDLSRLHILDWHESNIDRLEETLTQWAEQQPQYGRVKLHLSDAVNMEDLSAGTIHLVQMNNVLQHIEGIDGPMTGVLQLGAPGPMKGMPQKILDILREINRVLVPDGYLFMLGTKESFQLSAALKSFGFVRVQDHLWRRTA